MQKSGQRGDFWWTAGARKFEATGGSQGSAWATPGDMLWNLFCMQKMGDQIFFCELLWRNNEAVSGGGGGSVVRARRGGSLWNLFCMRKS